MCWWMIHAYATCVQTHLWCGSLVVKIINLYMIIFIYAFKVNLTIIISNYADSFFVSWNFVNLYWYSFCTPLASKLISNIDCILGGWVWSSCVNCSMVLYKFPLVSPHNFITTVGPNSCCCLVSLSTYFWSLHLKMAKILYSRRSHALYREVFR
jgi:hypothetical protein